MSHPILFLGSGASMGSGLPSTSQITKTLMNGEGFIRQTWNRYELGATSPAHVRALPARRLARFGMTRHWPALVSGESAAANEFSDQRARR
jgi:hypothetical protein